MKKLINDSLQSFQIWLIRPPNNKVIWLKPRKSIVIEDYEVSEMVKTLSSRKLIRIVNLPNQAKPVKDFMPVEFEQPKLSDVAPNINQKTSGLNSKKA
jgi:hypothetical protein